MRTFLLILLLSALSACSTNYPNKQISGQYFPSVSGQTLEKNKINIPKDFKNKTTLLLLGYTQNSQFDIDRWLIALDMTKTNVATYEIPTIQGLFPRMFSTTIDNGMRSGIPKSLWKGVVTVYKDGGIIQAFTGNDAPNNARVILINTNGKIIYFYDQGFSVDALNNLRDSLQTNG
jgi:cytochrome oxidase Cu insertion factor (SCO1/SenC/PrrC family)